MKLWYLSLFLSVLSCNFPKRDSSGKENKKETNSTEKVVINPVVPVYKNQLAVVLKNPENIESVEAYITNSGLKWTKMAFDDGESKIAIIEVPDGKSDFWLNRLTASNQFKEVKVNDKNVIDELIKKEKNTLISLRKTSCFGDCPTYELLIDKKGNATYNGKEYVLKKGVERFKLTNIELETMTKKLQKKEFSSYKDVYDNPGIMDLSSTYILHGGKQVQIRLWNDDVPVELMDLHEYIEGILLEKKFFE